MEQNLKPKFATKIREKISVDRKFTSQGCKGASEQGEREIIRAYFSV